MSASGGDEKVVVSRGGGTGHPRRRGIRRHWRLIALLILIVLVYLAVVSLYASSGRVESTGESPVPPPDGVTVQLTQQSVNASSETISMAVSLKASPQLEAGDATTLAQDVNVIISPVSGEQAITFAKGTIPGTQSINLLTSGAIENWPFDRYTSSLVVVAYTGAAGDELGIPTDVTLNGYLPGWNLSAEPTLTGDITVVTAEGEQNWPTIDLSARRSGSTLAFAIVLLSLLVVMPVLVLFVAITAYRGHRKVEASFMSWMGAMLFATIPLRSFLPGSPPIGSWIDFLVVLWVIVGLVAGLVIYVRAWVRWGTPSTLPAVPPTPPPTPAVLASPPPADTP